MIKVNGFDLRTLGVSVKFESPEAQTPLIRTNFAEKGNYGSINYGTTHGNAEFTFSCYIKGTIRTNIKEVIKLFLDDNGNYKEVKMEFDGWENRYYMVILSSPIELDPLSDKIGEFDINVTATFPFAHSIYATERYIGDLNTANGPYELPINYYGSFQTGFEFTFFGTMSYFDVEVHFQDGTKKVFHYVSGSHSTYFICDFVNFTINDNGANGLSNASGDFLYVNKATTKIVFRGDIAGSMNIKYREIYV